MNACCSMENASVPNVLVALVYTGYICKKRLWYGQRSQGDWPFVCKSRILNVFVLPQLSSLTWLRVPRLAHKDLRLWV